MIFKKQNKISVKVMCKACLGVGKFQNNGKIENPNQSSLEELQMMLKYCQGICLACNGLGFQIVEKFVEEK